MSEGRQLFPFIQGESVYLREVRRSGVTVRYYRWINDHDMTRFLKSRFWPNSMEGLGAYVESLEKDRDSVFLAIVVKENKIHIEKINVGPINWHHCLADVGIIVGQKEQSGKRYASEAVPLVARYAFDTLNLHKLTACYGCN